MTASVHPMSAREAWLRIVASTVATALLASTLCLGLWAALPALIGWHPTTVSSGSMLPRLEVGDIAVSRPLDGEQPQVGQVLLYDDPDHPGRLRMHRFIDVDEQGRIITKGDANPSRDSTPVELSGVIGVAFLRVPYIGLPIVWLRERAVVPLGVTAVLLLLTIYGTGLARHVGEQDPDDAGPDGGDGSGSGAETSDTAGTTGTAGAPAGHGPDRAAVRRVRGVVVAGAVLLCGPGLLLTPSAGALFTSADSNAGNTLAAAPWFSCVNAIRGDSPYLYWSFDEASGTVMSDGSGNGRPGTYTSAGKTLREAGACVRDPGYAVTFNGTSGYAAQDATSPRTNVFSIEIWFKTTTARGGRLIGYSGTRSGASTVYDRHLYLANNGTLYGGVYNGAVQVLTSRTAVNDGNWHHAVLTLSAAGLALYVDGESAGTNPAVTTAEGGNAGYWKVAFDNLDNWPAVPTSRYFAGTLDHAAIYVTALTAAQVKAHYEAGI